MDRSKFLKELKCLYPEVTEGINKQDGLLHFEMQVFRAFTEKAINADDKEKVKSCYSFAEKVFLNGDEKLKNAIDATYVEEFDFYGKKWAWEIFPENLKNLYVLFHHRKGV